MTDEEKFRLEEPEEKHSEEEKRGLFRPLPTVEKKTKMKEGRPQPIVRFFGFSMYENKRELLVLLLMPLLAAIIDVSIYSFVTVNLWESSSIFLFFIPVIAAIPIGLVVSDTGKSLIGGFLCSLYFVILFIIFLTTPALLSPELGLGNFIASGITLSIGYFILIIVASLLGSMIGTVSREFI
ncbi:hypothetical protein EU527_03335 [Candidatus Thorarchaeota archaeon]|nr:MAG: hypothetical protein EU527_03335 [Candidatus Thorarchaeota archaeon]